MPKQHKTCVAINCDETLTDNQTMYCGNRCKQAVKYAVKNGRQCAACHKPMKPRPVMGGYERYCDRVRCKKARQ